MPQPRRKSLSPGLFRPSSIPPANDEDKRVHEAPTMPPPPDAPDASASAASEAPPLPPTKPPPRPNIPPPPRTSGEMKRISAELEREIELISEELRLIAAGKPSGVRMKKANGATPSVAPHGAATVDEVVANRRRDPRCDDDEE